MINPYSIIELNDMCCISMEKEKEKEEREILINLELYSVHDFWFISPQVATPGPSKGTAGNWQ